jgi:hypothetical protein
MSYTYLQEQGEVSSAGCFSDIPQSVLLNLNLTAEKSYCNGNETESYQGSQSGMMSPPSTELRGEEKSMSSAEDSLAKTFPHQEVEQVSHENEADFGERWPESLAKYDLNTSSWRTAQCLLFEDLGESLEMFPRWGIMQNGELWERTMSAHLIEENESGFLPTVVKVDSKGTSRKRFRGSLDFRGGKAIEGLRTSLNDPLYIHPDFAEWMMGWPIEWTGLHPLEMDKFHLWLQQHGESLEENK